MNYDASYTASPSGSTAADSMGRASWEPQQPPRQTYGRRGLPKGRAPCPVDLLVPAGVKVVAVTGPNTGYPPIEPPHSASQQWSIICPSQAYSVYSALICCGWHLPVSSFACLTAGVFGHVCNCAMVASTSEPHTNCCLRKARTSCAKSNGWT